MTDRDAVTKAFTALAPRYEEVVDGELGRFWGWSYEGFIDQLFKLTPIASTNEGSLILDLATGTALIPRRLVDELKIKGQVVGLDITPAMLEHAQKSVKTMASPSNISLVCASAMAVPFPEESFDVVICGLGTHHMDVPQMLTEIRRVLKTGGNLALADVGASPSWKLPGVKSLLRTAAFLYFLPVDSIARAWAEAAAVSNVHTADEWRTILSEFGFARANVTRLPSRHFWTPDPLVMTATKAATEARNVNSH
jgi:ubiquinone/menaquinone biosynthesis C-methylase UbiE